MTTLERWLALLTLFGAIATALAVFVKAVVPAPVPPVAYSRSAEQGDCKTVLVIRGWWLMRCPADTTSNRVQRGP